MRGGHSKFRIGAFAIVGLAGTFLASTAMGAAITATWTGGTGLWSDAVNNATNWSFNTPPVTAAFPNNNLNDSFAVQIDNGAVGNSKVTLNTNVTID
jgi:hypothetical protein